MTIALWIIAICSVVRIIQNGIQLSMLIGERDLRKQLNNEFIDSLRKDNREWAEDALKRFVEAEQTETLPKDIVEPCGNGNVMMSEDTYQELLAEQTEPNSNADQHVQRVEYVEDDELKRCRECKHCVSEYRTPISASGRCYTYITCNANRCNYEQTEPQTERIKTLDYCDICNHKGCDNCVANNLDDYCVPSGYEPITKTETQNSNSEFEKRTMRDCYNCKRYETEGECIECHYEPKDEPQTELVRVKYHCINCAENGSYKCSKCDGEMYYKYDKDEPQTDCAWK